MCKSIFRYQFYIHKSLGGHSHPPLASLAGSLGEQCTHGAKFWEGTYVLESMEDDSALLPNLSQCQSDQSWKLQKSVAQRRLQFLKPVRFGRYV